MLPHQRNKVDVNSLNEEERKLFRLYGKLPSNKKDLLKKHQERKYFDSGDYALSKAGKASVAGVTNIGSQHPLPENIPHIHNSQKPGEQTAGANSSSPVKEASHLHTKSPMASEEPLTGEEAVDAEAQTKTEAVKADEETEAVKADEETEAVKADEETEVVKADEEEPAEEPAETSVKSVAEPVPVPT